MERMEELDLVCKGGVALYSDHHYHFETLGYHCCSREMPCKHGEGDCNRNDECLPGNLCREGSCTDSLGFSGGFWDASDSCCEQRCTAEHLCSEGWVLNQTHLYNILHLLFFRGSVMMYHSVPTLAGVSAKAA